MCVWGLPANLITMWLHSIIATKLISSAASASKLSTLMALHLPGRQAI